MIHAIIIDDEEKALKMLENKVKKYFPSIQIVFKTQSPKEGIEQIELLKPDLVFIDINMPKMSGFDVLSAISTPSFELIFVTAHNDYAIEAIKHCAIGYVVKPIDNDDLQLAVQNAIHNINKKIALKKNAYLLTHLSEKNNLIRIPSQNGLSFYKAKDILRLEGTDGYTKIVLQNESSILSSYNIGKFRTLLENHAFFQVHKSHLINIDHVRSYQNDGSIELSNGDTVPISKNRRKDFLDQI